MGHGASYQLSSGEEHMTSSRYAGRNACVGISGHISSQEQKVIPMSLNPARVTHPQLPKNFLQGSTTKDLTISQLLCPEDHTLSMDLWGDIQTIKDG